MGHDNIEKHLKKKLEKRAIQPSPEAWGKLSNMLDQDKKQANKKGFYYFTIAASIILLLGFFFTSQFRENDSIVIDDTVVTTDNNNVKFEEDNIDELVVEEYSVNDIVTEVQKSKIESHAPVNSISDAYAQSFKKKKEERQEEEINAIKNKVNDYLAQLQKNKQENLNQEKSEYDLDAEINALLAEASNNLPDKELKNKAPIFQLDKETDMLLANAFQELNFNPDEDTVNETLKDKLFKQLEKGYFKSKMLLAERSQLARP